MIVEVGKMSFGLCLFERTCSEFLAAAAAARVGNSDDDGCAVQVVSASMTNG